MQRVICGGRGEDEHEDEDVQLQDERFAHFAMAVAENEGGKHYLKVGIGVLHVVTNICNHLPRLIGEYFMSLPIVAVIYQDSLVSTSCRYQ